ncbi:MAG: GNAT family N-acetyltransferase [Jatrophihabitantaceae bacterium]
MQPTTTSSRPGGDGSPARFRLATESDWPLIWPFWQQIVAAGDTYCYDPAMGCDAGRRLWFGSPPDQVWLVTGSSDGVPVTGGSDGVPVTDGSDGVPVTGHSQATVLGSYRLGPNKAGPGSHIGTASYMVSEAARGRGIGRAMVLHCLDQAAAASYRGIQFNAVAASNVYAVQLYLELGFSVIGTVPGGFAHPQQGFVDLLIMFCEL